MPTYSGKGFGVRLHGWDPEQNRDSKVKDHLNLLPSDPSLGHPLEKFSEESFGDRNGIQWLGDSNVPFWLVNAGRNLFFDRDLTFLEWLKCYMNSHGALPVHDGGSSPLSSVPTPGSSASNDYDPRLHGEKLYNWQAGEDGIIRPKSWSQTPVPPLTSEDVFYYGKLKEPTPMKINYSFDEKTFKHVNAFLEDKQPQDLCVSVFYNGELVYCKVTRVKQAQCSNSLGKQPNCAGRRVGLRSEVPFMINPLADGEIVSSPSHRWNAVNAALRIEAGKWGCNDDGTPSPMSAYLQDLTDYTMPMELNGTRDGRNIGIIDIVVCSGRSKDAQDRLSHPARPTASLYNSRKASNADHAEPDELSDQDEEVEEPIDSDYIPDVGSSASARRKVKRKPSRTKVVIASPAADEEYHGAEDSKYQLRGKTGQTSGFGEQATGGFDDLKKRQRDASSGPDNEPEPKSEIRRELTEAGWEYVKVPVPPKKKKKNNSKKRKTKKTHLEVESPTPSQTKSQKGQDVQGSTPGSDKESAPANLMKNLDIAAEEDDEFQMARGSKAYNKRMFGLDGEGGYSSESSDAMLPAFSKPTKSAKPTLPQILLETGNTGNRIFSDMSSPPLPSTVAERPKPKLVINVGNANKDNASIQAAMSSPLTNRGYVHSPEGLKTPTPRSGNFPDIQRNLTVNTIPTETEFFSRSFDPAAEIVPKPASKPASSVITAPASRNKKRSRPSRTGPPAPPPPRSPSPDVPPPAMSLRPRKNQGMPQNRQSPFISIPDPVQTSRNATTRLAELAARRAELVAAEAQAANKPKVASSSRAKQYDDSDLKRPWKPVDLCHDSILTYAGLEQVGRWNDLVEVNEQLLPVRNTQDQHYFPFKQYSVMCGVRYVLGANLPSPEVRMEVLALYNPLDDLNNDEKTNSDSNGNGKQKESDPDPKGKGKERETDPDPKGKGKAKEI